MLRGGIEVRFLDNLGTQAAGSLHRRVKIVYLEPQHAHRVPVALRPG